MNTDEAFLRRTLLQKKHMKRIIFFTIICLPVALGAQKKVTFDTTFLNSTSANFFLENPVVDSIIFRTRHNGEKQVRVYTKTLWSSTAYTKSLFKIGDSYDLYLLGDNYLFEKKYGKLMLPTKEIPLLLNKRCSPSYLIEFTLYPDSIKGHLESDCPSKPIDGAEDYDFVLNKTEHLPSFKNGNNHLQSQIQLVLANELHEVEISTLDSVLIYKVLVDPKDSCLKTIELIEGRYSPFEQMVIEVLKTYCYWLPAQQGGRTVFSYTKLFIRLNNDKSVTVDL